MFKSFYPDEYLESIYEIDFDGFYKKGYRAVIFDIDNTLVAHGEPSNKKIIAFSKELMEKGMKICLMSNNQLERVKPFADSLGLPFIEDAHKPSRKSYRKAMDLLGTNTSNTIFVGDQLFTDIFGAKRSGIKSILVEPIHPKEEIQIVVKRYLEKVVLYFYNRQRG